MFHCYICVTVSKFRATHCIFGDTRILRIVDKPLSLKLLSTMNGDNIPSFFDIKITPSSCLSVSTTQQELGNCQTWTSDSNTERKTFSTTNFKSEWLEMPWCSQLLQHKCIHNVRKYSVILAKLMNTGWSVLGTTCEVYTLYVLTSEYYLSMTPKYTIY